MKIWSPERDLEGEIYGQAPVQAEGTVRGHPFYFRARHDGWSFDIGPDPIGGTNVIFSRESDYGEPRGFEASWMEHDEALGFLLRCVDEFLAEEPTNPGSSE